LQLLGYALLAFAPGLFWLWFFVRGRAYRAKPMRLLAFAFFLGMLSTAPAAALEFAFLRNAGIEIGADLATATAATRCARTRATAPGAATACCGGRVRELMLKSV
jgi:RsiW-degrading membrane proteinase PrsW (M82 family)